MRYQKFELFPTHVYKFDFSHIITQSDVLDMIADVDQICNNKDLMQINELTPMHQCKPILFKNSSTPVWHKLKETFLASCKMYLQSVENFVHNSHSLEFTDARAWFYKGWKSLNVTQSNPWHNHNPSFLSGVFYVKVPNAPGGGTSFMDPRLNESKQTVNVIIEPTELCWVIFPGWMYHKSEHSDSEEPRYVIAADSYIKVI